ncbi:MAG: shikimate dehydrogenase [Actinobacteria bacterium]|nr:shikimate dehydrogenase [Actinomycetota bacterium]
MSKSAAVLGSPISHSLSPLIHNHAYRLLNYPATYKAIEVRSGELERFLQAQLSNPDLVGFSLTMPLKEEVTQLAESLVEIDSRSKTINSANTIYRDQGKWKATSTDVDGFVFLLRDFSFTSVSILGAGGTARAAIAALASRNCKIDVYRRSKTRDRSLKNSALGSQIAIKDWNECNSAWNGDLVINSIPSDQVSSIAESFNSPDIFLDATYSPWPPMLSKLQLSSKGLLISGLQLLAAQAVGQVALMTGLDFDADWLYSQSVAELEKFK